MSKGGPSDPFTIFISYRREETSGHAGRLYDSLADQFGADQVFMDVDAMAPGVDFVLTLTNALESVEVLLAVIGPQWAERDADGRRRLDDPEDFVRFEVRSALERQIRVIPVLVRGASMPTSFDLPEDLRALAHRQAFELSDHRWRDDVAALRSALETMEKGERRPEPPAGLPPVSLGLVGRDRELGELRSLLERRECPLITLLGPGGVGKTSLALQVATDSGPLFPDGVSFVPLASIADPDLVVPTIGQALGALPSPGGSMAEALVSLLRRAPNRLLVLDNFEQLTGAASDVGTLLAQAPTLKLLVTSRTPLRLRDEQQYAVAPLASSSAVELFLQRAARVRTGWSPSAEDHVIVGELCRRLDGLPLAIELAASRVKLLSVRNLLGRLDRRLPLLTTGPADAPSRHQTLRNAIDWSHGLLSPPEQILFRRLSAFPGGCTLDAAEAVCTEPGDGSDVLDGLTSLVDSSLLVQQEHDDEIRFSMLETIREYGREQLADSEEADAVLDRHAGHFLALAERVGPELTGPDQVHWLDVLELEHPNLRASLQWAVDAGVAELGLRLAGSLWRFWEVRGYLIEGERWLEQVLGLGQEPRWARARAVRAAGNLARDRGRLEASADHHRESLRLYREADDDNGVASSLCNLANVALDQGLSAEAAILYEESLAIFRRLGEDRNVALLLNNLGMAAHGLGDDERARTLLQESVVLSRGLGETRNMSRSLDVLGQVSLSDGRPDEAADHHRQALALRVGLGDREAVATTLEGLANVALAKDRPVSAARLLGQADALRDLVGEPLAPRERLDYEAVAQGLRAALGEEAFDTARSEGGRLTQEEVVAEASRI